MNGVSDTFAVTAADAAEENSDKFDAANDLHHGGFGSIVMDDVPEVAIRWCLIHSMSSNAELATISNINRRWRQIAKQSILEQIINERTSIKTAAATDTTANQCTATSTRPLLLLPSMLRRFICLCEEKECYDIGSKKELETFCAAWFHPGGIQEMYVSLTDCQEDEEYERETREVEEKAEIELRRLKSAAAARTANASPPSSPKSSRHASQFFLLPQQQQAAAGGPDPLAPSLDLLPPLVPNGEPVLYEEDKDNDVMNNRGDSTEQQNGGTTVNNNKNNNKNSTLNAVQKYSTKLHTPAEVAAAAAAAEQQQQQQRNHHLKPKRDHVICSHEWRGYRIPMDILRPFGYCVSFVDELFFSCHESVSSLLDVLPKYMHHYQANFCVRGATVARPEGYCLCYDEEGGDKGKYHRHHHHHHQNPDMSLDTTADFHVGDHQDEVLLQNHQHHLYNNSNNNNTHEAAAAGAPAAIRSDDENSRMVESIRLQEYRHVLWRRKRRRQELQRQVLPRVLFNPNCNIFNNNKNKNKNNNTFADNLDDIECLQFLNADGGHAVCMMTPLFECGPLAEPITIFCVGIATEDGCFLSGLRHRFEFGHLYPDPLGSTNTTAPDVAANIQLSPICVALNPVEHHPYDDDDAAADAAAMTGATGGDDYKEGYDEFERNNNSIVNKYSHHHHNNDDDSSCDDSDNDSSLDMKCTCTFKGITDKFDNLQDNHRSHDDDSSAQSRDTDRNQYSQNEGLPPQRIHRGHVGPGNWHCYVAIINGESTKIRIDGIEDATETDFFAAASSSSINEEKSGLKALLDGLTIGSDHDFGMTLCSGYGSGGEGQGAIAEVAVFQGCLDDVDVHVLEGQLMQKYGIEPITDPPEMVFQDHDFKRRAQAFFAAAIPPQHPQLYLQQHQQQQQQLRDPNPTNSGTNSSVSSSCQFKSSTSSGGGGEDEENKSPSSSAVGVPLRYLARHRSVAWELKNPVTGEPIAINKIGCRPGAESSDW